VTVTVYRLGRLRYQRDLFAGLDGLYARGRWTLRGHPVVYTSQSISLAVLEYTVNYRHRGWIAASVVGRAVIPSSVAIETVKATDLPSNWANPVAPVELQQIGRIWLERRASVALRVPSAVVVEEWNYLLNPAHPDFKKLSFGKPKPCAFDRRLAPSRRT
jgi:RES domain-containing protein